MFFPHTLEKKVLTEAERDEFGRIVAPSEEQWVEVCPCRCDDNTTKEFTNENGTVYRPSYHVVCKGRVDLSEGDEVRCMAETLRGEGKVYSVSRCNYFNRSEIWI